MVCTRCSGLLAKGYDVGLRETYQYCLNCGARPTYQTRRMDGRSVHEPIYCRHCKAQPVATILRKHAGPVVSRLCWACRAEELARRRRKSYQLHGKL